MATKVVISEATFCDWCVAADREETPALLQRRTQGTEAIDLCVECGILWDLVSLRLEYAMVRLQEHVVETLLRGAHSTEGAPAEPPRRVRKALGLDDGPTSSEAPTPQLPPVQGPVESAQPILPIPREDGSQEPLYVACLDDPCNGHVHVPYTSKSRGSHARRVHQKNQREVGWVGVGFDLEYTCTVHPECVESGFGFRVERELRSHKADSMVKMQASRAAAQQAKKAVPTAKAKKKRSPNVHNGERIEGADQVVCPLKHREGAPSPYFVHEKNRGAHAAFHGKKLGEEWGISSIDYENPLGIEWFIYCNVHDACVRHNGGKGVGFMSENAIGTHWQKGKERGERQPQEA